MTAVHPTARFGALVIGDPVREFIEKPQTRRGWINGGFFVFEPEVLDYLTGRRRHPRARSRSSASPARARLMAFQHEGFWQPMDTPAREEGPRDALWESGNAPWKTW